MIQKEWAAGIDLGGTKIQILEVDRHGNVGEQIRSPTDVSSGPTAIIDSIIDSIKQLEKKIGLPPAAIGIGIAGQVDAAKGTVLFAPNLKWSDIPIKKTLYNAIGVPIIVTNDVRAATWGEWLHGAGRGCENIVCIFVGTGVGGGIVIDGKMLNGASNTAGEIGHIVVAMDGAHCACGGRGCLEAYAGGWAMTQQAKEWIAKDPKKGAQLLKMANDDVDAINGRIISDAARMEDPLASHLLDEAVVALSAGAISLVNALNPERIIFGGGVIEGMPELILSIEERVHQHALKAATRGISFAPAMLKGQAGAIGAAALAFLNQGDPMNID